MFVCNLCMQPNLSALLSLLPSSPVQRIETPLWSGPQLQSHQLLDISCICPNLGKWGVEHGLCYATCTNEGWNCRIFLLCNLYKRGMEQYITKLVQMRGGTVQYFVVQLVQLRGGTVQYSFVMQLVQMTSNWSKWGVEHSTIFICYANYTNEVELVQMRGGTQNNERPKSHFRFPQCDHR